MAALTVWKSPDADGADAAVDTLHSLEKQQLINLLDGATVAWAPTAKRPKTRQLHSLNRQRRRADPHQPVGRPGAGTARGVRVVTRFVRRPPPATGELGDAHVASSGYHGAYHLRPVLPGTDRDDISFPAGTAPHPHPVPEGRSTWRALPEVAARSPQRPGARSWTIIDRLHGPPGPGIAEDRVTEKRACAIPQ